jgi:hypothetical protein
MSEQKRRAKPNDQSELLFDETTAKRPRWAELSHEAQRSVTELFARMLRQRRQGRARSVAHEVEHE